MTTKNNDDCLVLNAELNTNQHSSFITYNSPLGAWEIQR